MHLQHVYNEGIVMLQSTNKIKLLLKYSIAIEKPKITRKDLKYCRSHIHNLEARQQK